MEPQGGPGFCCSETMFFIVPLIFWATAITFQQVPATFSLSLKLKVVSDIFNQKALK